MGKKLVIVESPAKCKTIGRYLGPDYSVKATLGHVSDLPERELGVDLENDFRPHYVIPEEKYQLLSDLRREAARADRVYLAADPDREGEAIAWQVAEQLQLPPEKIYRIQFNEITESAVKRAVQSPSDIDMNRVNAQQARRVLDRIVGYSVSPILWKTLYRGLTAGRVQSVALRMICEREKDILAFTPEEFWTVSARMIFDRGSFSAKLQRISGKQAVLTNEADALAVELSLYNQPFLVTDVVKERKERKPQAPFITSTLQQEASRVLGFSTAKSMNIAQQLYEGVELGPLGSAGLITYMRTDSPRISQEALIAVRELISEFFDEPYLSREPRIHGSSKSVQDAHEAIRPANISADYAPSVIREFLSRDQFRLYELIWNRFIASQMSDALIENTEITIEAADTVFQAQGSALLFDGFLTLYSGADDRASFSELPEIPVGTSLFSLVEKKQHFTEPPARFSEAALVRELEKRGIGRPSTYAQIIQTLKKRDYVVVEKGCFLPTEIARSVTDILVANYSDIFEEGFTVEMERKLDLVEEGSENWIDIMRSFYRPFEDRMTAVTARLKDIKSSQQRLSDRSCPECGEFPLLEKWGRNGKFLACANFPKCKYTESLESETFEESDLECSRCGAPMVNIRRGKSSFLGCSAYPACDNTTSLSTGVACPVTGCRGELLERYSKRGKRFYSCSSYPNCEYATWDKPLQEKCPHCGYDILVEKDTKAKGRYKQCPGCKKEFEINDTD